MSQSDQMVTNSARDSETPANSGENRPQKSGKEQNTPQQDDIRRSSERNDNPKSFDDNYEVEREDEMTRDEAKSEKQNRGGKAS